jgi:hypothetical protein
MNLDNGMKYFTTKENVLKTLNKYGVAVIPEILNEIECDNAKNGMWDTLEHMTCDWDIPILRDDPETWKEIRKLSPYHDMLLHNYEIGHAQFIWDIRQNEKIVDVFSRIWRTHKEDLLVSFDGLSISLPPEFTLFGWQEDQDDPMWLHTDQSFTRNEFECVQSFFTPYEVREKDATFVFLEKSHLYHSRFRETFNITSKRNYCRLNDDDVRFYKQLGCEEKRISCPAGSLILWDSRLIHSGGNAFRSRNKKNTRCAIYLCYYPLVASTEEYLSRKRYAFENKIMTNHYAYKADMFPKFPYESVVYTRSLPSPRLTKLGRQLAGYING